MEQKNNRSFASTLKATVLDLIKNPKKLMPSIILAVIWMLFSILSTVGVNIPIFRFLYTLTFANGGMFGGFFGAVGGILGKAVFAAVVNGLVLSVCDKKNPFKGLKTSLNGVVSGGLKAVSPFILGGGIGILLYYFFNVTSAEQNCAISIACALAGIKALTSQNGLLFMAVFYFAKKVSKGKAPSQITVSRVLAGLTAGFAISFPITFLRLPILILVLGILLTVGGILIPFTGAKKVVAAALVLIFVFSLGSSYAYAADDSFCLVISPFFKEHKEKYGYHYNNWDQWVYYAFYQAGEVTVERNSDGNYSFTLPGYNYSFSQTDSGSYEVTIPDLVFVGSEFTKEGDGKNPEYRISFDAQLGDGISTNLIYTSASSGKTSTYVHELKSFTLKLWFYTKDKDGSGIQAHSSGSEAKYRDFPEGTADPDNYTYWCLSPEHFSQGFTIYGFDKKFVSTAAKTKSESTDSADSNEEDENNYKPYRGRLTYTNGRVNKYGQPFPDLMDFDNDGEITWLDMNIQKELSHDPDWLDRPLHPTAGVMLAILTGLIGAGLGSVGAALGGALGAAGATVAEATGEILGSAVSDASSNIVNDIFANNKYVTRDSDGDLNVTDPATGEKRLYKSNGDGTYTNPLTGATYTEAELNSSLESRSENASLFQQDAQILDAAIEEQRAENQGKSQIAIDYEAQKAALAEQQRLEALKEDYMNKLLTKYDAKDLDELRGKVADAQGQAEIEHYEQMELEVEYYKSQKYAENVKQTADVAIDVLAEIEPTGTGKKIKDAYTVGTAAASNIGEVISGDKTVGGAFVQTTIDASLGLAKNHADDFNFTGTGGYAEKAVLNTMGDGVAATTNELFHGKSLEEAQKEGSKAAKQGGVNFLVDTGFDAVGKGMGALGLEGKNTAGTILNSDITRDGLNSGIKTLGADLTKNKLAPDDPDDAAFEKYIKDRGD